MNSGFDMEMLHAELDELDIDMEEFGFTSIDPVDIDQFFEDAEPKEKEPKQIQCPHCGEWFEQ
jgi:hypothetical protein